MESCHLAEMYQSEQDLRGCSTHNCRTAGISMMARQLCAKSSMFDVAVGDDNLFDSDKRKWSAQLTVMNIANQVALYNFLSTFSGTHYVTPRALTAQLGFSF